MLVVAACTGTPGAARVMPEAATSPTDTVATSTAQPPTATGPVPTALPTAEGIPPGAVMGHVTKILDGESIFVLLEGSDSSERKVHYLGLDAPDFVQGEDEPFASEAAAANAALLAAGVVYLEKDVSEADSNGRLLRYVYLPDGTFVNAELIAGGYARSYSIAPDVRYTGLFDRLQDEAMQDRLGVWGLTTPTPRLSPTPWWLSSATPAPLRRATQSSSGAVPSGTATPSKAWTSSVGGGGHGVTGTLSLEARKTTFAANQKIWFTFTLVNSTGAPIPYGVLGVVASDLDPADGNGGLFHTSWNGQLTESGTLSLRTNEFKYRDNLVLSRPGQYALRVSMCFSPYAECLAGGAWEDLSGNLIVTISP